MGDGLYMHECALEFTNQNVDSWQVGVDGLYTFALEFTNQNVDSWQIGVDGHYMFEGALEFTS